MTRLLLHVVLIFVFSVVLGVCLGNAVVADSAIVVVVNLVDAFGCAMLIAVNTLLLYGVMRRA